MHTCFFLSPHLPGLLPILCDGQHRPVQRWPLFGRKRPFASWGGTLRRVQISRFQIDATLTNSFALRRASSRGNSCTSLVVVVVGRLVSTGCQRPAAKRHFSWRVWPQTPRGSPGSYVYAHMHFSFPSSACPASHRLRRPAPTGAAMATFRPKATFHKLGGYVATGPNLSISNRCHFDRFFRVTTCQQPRRLLHVSSRRRRRSASEHGLPAASGLTTLISARLAPNPARLAGLAGSAGLDGLVRVCTHAFSFPSSAWPASHRLRRPAPTGAATATFRPKATFRKQGGVRCDGSKSLDFKSMRLCPILSRYDVPAAAATPSRL